MLFYTINESFKDYFIRIKFTIKKKVYYIVYRYFSAFNTNDQFLVRYIFNSLLYFKMLYVFVLLQFYSNKSTFVTFFIISGKKNLPKDLQFTWLDYDWKIPRPIILCIAKKKILLKKTYFRRNRKNYDYTIQVHFIIQ